MKALTIGEATLIRISEQTILALVRTITIIIRENKSSMRKTIRMIITKTNQVSSVVNTTEGLIGND